jgi:galactonate dehydratase
MRITACEPMVIVPDPASAYAGVGGPGMTGNLGTWFWVRLSTDADIDGWGEIVQVPFSPTVACAMLRDLVQHRVLGWDPYETEELFQRLYHHGYGHQADATKLALISGIECACWDIVGKDRGVPVHRLLGGACHPRVRTYTYNHFPDGRTSPPATSSEAIAERDAAMALACLEAGFTAVKLDPLPAHECRDRHQHVPYQLASSSLDHAALRFRRIREAVGSRLDLGIGTHGQMAPDAAIRLARRLEPFDPFFFEEPVPPEDIGALAEVARATSIPIATGERHNTLWDFQRILDARAAKLLQFDLGRCGGMLQAKKIAAMAEATYCRFQPHNHGGPLLMAASVQLDLCCPNFEIQECIGTMGGAWADAFVEPMQWKDGYIIPSSRPGLGHEPSPAFIAKHRVS